MLLRDHFISIYAGWARTLYVSNDLEGEKHVRRALQTVIKTAGMGLTGSPYIYRSDFGHNPSHPSWKFGHRPTRRVVGRGHHPTMGYTRFQAWNGHEVLQED